jgi:DNA-binding NtrC family response regulator
VENIKGLLAITELGGYPDFTGLYTKSGFNVEVVNSMRKALRSLKKHKFGVVVAEFNFQSDFRDRTSSLETLMAVLQQMDGVKVIIFYEKEYLHQFEKLRARFLFHAELAYPIDKLKLEAALKNIH